MNKNTFVDKLDRLAGKVILVFASIFLTWIIASPVTEFYIIVVSPTLFPCDFAVDDVCHSKAWDPARLDEIFILLLLVIIFILIFFFLNKTWTKLFNKNRA